MKMTKTILITLISICVLGYACKEAIKDPSDNIDDQYAGDTLKFDISKSRLIESLDSIKIKKIIKLEIDTAMPLGRIDKLVIAKDRLFVLDRTFSKLLFVYSKQGEFLYKIGDKGHGPGEYINGPKDFYVDELSKITTVFDSEFKTIYTYNWDGELMKTRRLKKTWPYSFTKSDSVFYFAYKTVDTDSYLLRIEDENENTFFKYKRLPNKRDVIADECFYNAGRYIYFVEDFNNNIVVLKDKGIEKILSIDFGLQSIEKDFLTKYKGDEFIDKALANEAATRISRIVETDQLFAFQFVFSKMGGQIIYNKENKNYLTGVSLNYGSFPSTILTHDENYLVSALSAESIEMLLAAKENPDAWDRLINSAHPAIKDILLNSKAGKTDDYIFIYDLRI